MRKSRSPNGFRAMLARSDSLHAFVAGGWNPHPQPADTSSRAPSRQLTQDIRPESHTRDRRMHPDRPHTYRITVEEADGSSHQHQLVVLARELAIGDVLEAGEQGWSGPRVTIEEIDRHPDANQDGAAQAWPLPTLFRPSPPAVHAPDG